MLQCPRWSNEARPSLLTLNKPSRGRQRPDVAGSRGCHGDVLAAPSVSEMSLTDRPGRVIAPTGTSAILANLSCHSLFTGSSPPSLRFLESQPFLERRRRRWCVLSGSARCATTHHHHHPAPKRPRDRDLRPPPARTEATFRSHPFGPLRAIHINPSPRLVSSALWDDGRLAEWALCRSFTAFGNCTAAR